MDRALQTRWTIWPFVWRIVGDEEQREGNGEERDRRLQGLVKLDWEHESVVFVRPEEVEGMRTVDDLARSVRAVLEEDEEEG